MATQDEAAKHIDMSRRTFIEYVNKGIITKAPMGEYDLDAVRSEYLNHLLVEAVRKGNREAARDLTDRLNTLAAEAADARKQSATPPNGNRRAATVSRATGGKKRPH